MRTCLIPNWPTTGTPGPTWTMASWFLDPKGGPIKNYAISMGDGSCYNHWQMPHLWSHTKLSDTAVWCEHRGVSFVAVTHVICDKPAIFDHQTNICQTETRSKRHQGTQDTIMHIADRLMMSSPANPLRTSVEEQDGGEKTGCILREWKKVFNRIPFKPCLLHVLLKEPTTLVNRVMSFLRCFY